MKGSIVRGSMLALFLVSALVVADATSGIPVIQVPQVTIPGSSAESIVQETGDQEPVNGAESEEKGLHPEAINYITSGTIVFIGEQHLDISNALSGAGAIAWWNSTGGAPGLIHPDAVVQVSDSQNFYIDPTLFAGKSGNWYCWQNDTAGPVAIRIEEPSLRLRIWDATTGEDASGKTIPVGNFGNFVIESNLYSIMNRTGVQPGDAPVRIRLTGPANETYTTLVGADYREWPLTHLGVNEPLWYWVGLGDDHTKYQTGDGWNTSVLDPFTSERLYYPGVYTVRAECNANKMKDNYRAPDGSEYVNKTVSASVSVTLVDNIVSIEVEKEEVTLGDSFNTTITGLPNKEYHLWVKGTSNMTGLPGDQPPSIAYGQHRVLMDDPAGPYEVGRYVFSDGGGKTIRQDVPTGDMFAGTRYYAIVKLDSAGTRVVTWNTSSETATGQYTLAVEDKTYIGYTRDSVPVTLVPSGGPEEIRLLAGWNFISTPTVLKNGSNTLAIFSEVNSSGHSIFGYDGMTGSWVSLKAHDPFTPLNAIWVYSAGDYSVLLYPELSVMVPPRTLAAGWNTLGIASPDRNVSQALTSIRSLWSYLVGYDSEKQQYRDPIINNESGDTLLKTKDGFWIYMKENGTFTG